MSEQETHLRSVWLDRLRGWRERLDQAGLGGLADGLQQGLRPLGPLAAQVLWFSQPGFALFGQYEAIGGLADLLDDWPGDSAAPSHDDG
jgi:hypothetical protein